MPACVRTTTEGRVPWRSGPEDLLLVPTLLPARACGSSTIRSWTIASLALALSACAPSVDHEAEALEDRPVVVVTEVLTAPPEGADGPETVALAREDDGVRTHVRGPALGGVPFLDGALVLRVDRSLEMVRGPHGVGSVIDREVLFAPVASSDGEHVAWAAEHGPETVLVVIDREGARTNAAQGLASIGAVVFDASTQGSARRLAFVAARNGGIAGVWAARVDGSGLSCLTNCELRAGQPLDERHVPLPTEPIAFEGDAVVLRSMAHEDRLALPEILR